MSEKGLSKIDFFENSVAPNWDAYTVVCDVDISAGMRRLRESWRCRSFTTIDDDAQREGSAMRARTWS
jgi:hypothetical protein